METLKAKLNSRINIVTLTHIFALMILLITSQCISLKAYGQVVKIKGQGNCDFYAQGVDGGYCAAKTQSNDSITSCCGDIGNDSSKCTATGTCK